MRTFASSDTNDFAIVGRSLAIISGVDAVLDVCAHVAQALLGEMVFAKDQGMPYFQTVWVGAPRTAPFEAAFRARIAQVDGVQSIDELTTEQVGDTMRYRAVITTIYGPGVING